MNQQIIGSWLRDRMLGVKNLNFRTKHWVWETFRDQAAEESQASGTDTGQSEHVPVVITTSLGDQVESGEQNKLLPNCLL